MTASHTTHRLTSVLALAVLAILVLAPAASAKAGPDQRYGWERTSVATGGSGGGQLVQAGPETPVDGPRGWEATGTATTRSARTVATDTGTSSFAISATMLYGAALVATLIVGMLAIARQRSHHRPHVA